MHYDTVVILLDVEAAYLTCIPLDLWAFRY